MSEKKSILSVDDKQEITDLLEIYFIMLTAKVESADKINGIAMGQMTTSRNHFSLWNYAIPFSACWTGRFCQRNF